MARETSFVDPFVHTRLDSIWGGTDNIDSLSADEYIGFDTDKVVLDVQINRDSDVLVNKLSKLESALCSIVLHQCVDKLFTLGAPMVRLPVKIDYRNVKQRFGSEEAKETLYDLDTNERIRGNRAKRRWRKLQKDRDWAIKALCMAGEEIQNSGTMVGLSDVIAAEEMVEMEESNLELDAFRNITAIDKIHLQRKRDKCEAAGLIESKSKDLIALEAQLQETMYECGIKLAYAEHYQKARVEQNRFKFQIEEEELFNSIEGFLHIYTRERLCHANIMRFLDLSIEKMEEKIEYWSNRYTKEVDARDIEIMTIRTKRADENDKMAELYDVYNTRRDRMKLYLEQRAERERIQAENDKINSMALRIQAWWRGTMVRRKLGPYAPKKKEKKEKKKK